MITIQIEHEWRICKHCRHSHLQKQIINDLQQALQEKNIKIQKEVTLKCLATIGYWVTRGCYVWKEALQPTKAFMAPAFLWWLNPGRFSLDTYTNRGSSFPSVSCPPLWPKNTCATTPPCLVTSKMQIVISNNGEEFHGIRMHFIRIKTHSYHAIKTVSINAPCKITLPTEGSSEAHILESFQDDLVCCSQAMVCHPALSILHLAHFGLWRPAHLHAP